jgi:hypothetical protein
MSTPILRCSETKSLPQTSHSWRLVIPGEPRETRNPGGITIGKRIFFLDASLRWHDGKLFRKITLT